MEVRSIEPMFALSLSKGLVSVSTWRDEVDYPKSDALSFGRGASSFNRLPGNPV